MDVVWALEDPPMSSWEPSEYAKYRGLYLAAECEWDGTPSALIYDLVKLVDIRANLRLFFGTLKDAETQHREVLRHAQAVLVTHAHACTNDEVFVALWGKETNKLAGTWILGTVDWFDVVQDPGGWRVGAPVT
jgi:hypothetical protein